MSGDKVDDSDPGGLRAVAALSLEAGLASLAADAEYQAERIARGHYFVVCVGQFKRGKSTLLNALVGEAVLPTGVAPVTSVVTVIRYGPERGARVRAAGHGWESIPLTTLSAYVSEAQNPQNAKGVQAIEVILPSPLLASGMCLVDTPGVGSVFAAGTEATQAFVPHIDAALVVLGGDPPISAEELTLVAEVAAQVDTLMFVLSKADRLSHEDLREASAFTAGVLQARLGRLSGPLFQVSAVEQLKGDGPPRDWAALLARLKSLSDDSEAALVRQSVERSAAHFAGRLIRALDEQLRALRQPIEETERRLEELRSAIAELERTLRDLAYVLTAEQDRVTRAVTAEREQFIERARTEAARELERAILGLGSSPAAELRRGATILAQVVARRHLDTWLAKEQPITEARYRAAAQRFVDLANDFLMRFTVARDLGFDRLPSTLATEAGFRVRSRLVYTELLRLTTPNWLTWALDRLGPRRWMVRRTLADASTYLDLLLASNSARIQNDLVERVRESRNRLESELRSRLAQALASAEQALARARERHAAGREAVAAEIERVDGLRRGAEILAARP